MPDDESQPSSVARTRKPVQPDIEDPSSGHGRIEQRKNSTSVNIAVQQSPYPPAQDAEVYERLHPGAFARILSMTERAQHAEIAEAERLQNFAQRDTQRGHWLGWSATIIALGCATVLGYLDHTAAAIAVVSLPVFSSIKGLIDSTKRK